eukprot:360359-Chlamydomonas_euryale.AAC.7
MRWQRMLGSAGPLAPAGCLARARSKTSSSVRFQTPARALCTHMGMTRSARGAIAADVVTAGDELAALPAAAQLRSSGAEAAAANVPQHRCEDDSFRKAFCSARYPAFLPCSPPCTRNSAASRVQLS